MTVFNYMRIGLAIGGFLTPPWMLGLQATGVTKNVF